MMLGRGNARIWTLGLVAIALVVLIVAVPRTKILPNHVKAYLNLPHEQTEEEKPLFDPGKWGFQADIDWLEENHFDFEKLKGLPPHNYKGPGHPTFATLYATRDATTKDPYFIAAQQIVYRLLWGQRTKSTKYPVTVFVTQYVNETQRDYFRAAGAIVRELAIHPFEPSMKGVPARLQDMFSKFDMWKQKDFTRIAYLDSDAIPITNIDDIFDHAPEKACRWDLLPEEDKAYGVDICKYAFSAWPEYYDKINAGVMIFKPEVAMYQRLIRESKNTSDWDTGYLEQALLSKLYNPRGPFVPSRLPMGYNSFPDYVDKGIEIRILHDKMWMHFVAVPWADKDWKGTWEELLEFYQSDEFYQIRLQDKAAMQAVVEKDAKRLGYVDIPVEETT